MNNRSDARNNAWGIVFACAGAMFISYVDRVSISVAGLSMQREFGWSEATKGIVLSSFFVGYLAIQIVGGWLAHRFGGRRIMLWALTFWSACMILTPLAAHTGLAALIVMRIALGLGEGPLNPAAFAIIGRWVPATGCAQATSIYASASFLGTMSALAGIAWLTARFGWPSVFYVCGALGFVYALAVARILPDDSASAASEPTGGSVPWRDLLAIGPFWALAYAFFCTNWILYVLLLWMPSYFAASFGLSLIGTGLFSLVPWAVMFAAINLAGWLADVAVRRGLGVTLVRKLWAGVGLFTAGTALILVQWADTPDMALGAFCLVLGGIAIAYASFSPNTYDLAPHHAHILYAIMNTFGSVPGIVGVAVTGFLVGATGSYDRALSIAGLLAWSGAMVFMLWGTGRRRYPARAG